MVGPTFPQAPPSDMFHKMKHIARTGPGFAIGEFEQVVLLALIRLGADTYGAAIRREIEARTGRELAISAVYITLDRLESKGFVRSRIGDPTPQRGGRRRKHFTLLPAGRRAIVQVCRTFSLMVEGLDLA
jgi:PadR family transcriptional regulator PadR